MSKRSLSRTWCLVATGLFGAALALSFTGCGGSGQREAPAPPKVHVYLRWYDEGWWGYGHSLLVVEDPPGTCYAEQCWDHSGADPVGNFEMTLTTAQLEELRAAVRRAIEALNAGYPPPGPEPPGWPWPRYVCTLAYGRDKATVPDRYFPDWFPEPALPLLGPGGLLDKLYAETLEHPLAAIALSAAPDRVQYCPGEPIRLTLTVTSVGRDPVAFTPRSCRKIVDGLITVTAQPSSTQEVLREQFRFGSSEPPQWEDYVPPRLVQDVRVLSPGDTYTFRLPPVGAPRVSGHLTITVTLRVTPRYDTRALMEAAGAVVAMGEWRDSLDVVVWP